MGQIFCSSLSEIAAAIKDPAIKVVSFDVFDTLIARPLKRESDLFFLLGRRYREAGGRSDFTLIRTEADSILRRQIIAGQIAKEDITIDEIYEVMAQKMGVDLSLCDELQKLEEELYISLACPRESGRKLLEESLAAGKKTVLISDMYLKGDTIRAILERSGIKGYSDMLVSSDTGLRKLTGNLFRYAAEKYNVAPEEMLHIGDYYESDIKTACEAGLNAVLLPPAEKVFEEKGCLEPSRKLCSTFTDLEAARSSLFLGACEKMAANMYFDDPFREFTEGSCYNADPYFAGYAALGPQVLQFSLWLSSKAKEYNASRMIFLSRDGYLPKKEYDMLADVIPGLPESDYLPVSRLSVLPAMFSGPSDLFTIPLDPSYHTAQSVFGLLSFCCRDGVTVEDILPQQPADEKLTRGKLTEFISAFIAKAYDSKKHQESIKTIRDFLISRGVNDDSLIFDMGYSGRTIAAMGYASGKKPHVCYFHKDARSCHMYEQMSGIKIDAFLDMSPQMEATMREYSYLEDAPSCIGYGSGLQPLYDCGPAKGYSASSAPMQEGALKFVSDYLKYFAPYLDSIRCRNLEASVPFEAFIRFCPEYDRKIYEGILIDDELWGGRRDIDLRRLMEARLSKLPSYARRD